IGRKTGNNRFLESGMRIAEALFATQHADGLRSNCLSGSSLRERGLAAAADRPASMNPHFESIAHAAYIQAYLVSGVRKFKDLAVKGSLHLLRNPERLTFMYSRTSGMNRFVLPAAYFAGVHGPMSEIDAGLNETLRYLASH